MANLRLCGVFLRRSLLLAAAAFHLISCAPAYTLTAGVFDYNTLNPLNAANITISNASAEVGSGLTDATGYSTIDTRGQEALNVTAWKLGYITNLDPLAYTTDSNHLIYLMPISTTGIIRLRIQDLTLGGRNEYCVSFQENNRTLGCFMMNDTVTLLTNRNYTITPQLTKADLLATPRGLKTYGFFYIPYIIGGFVLIGIAAVVIYILLWRKHG